MRKLLIIGALLLAGCTTPAQHFADTEQALQLANRQMLAAYAKSLQPLVDAHKLTHAQATQKIYAEFVDLYGHNADADEFWTYAIYLASEEDKGHLSHEKRVAMLTAKQAEIGRKERAEQMERLAAMSQAQQARAARQQSAVAAGMMGWGLMQMGAPHPAFNPVINCNSIQQGVFTNTTCQ